MSEDEKEGAPCCGICGDSHDINRCSHLLIQDHVLDKIAPSKARLTLPDKLRLETLSDGSHTIEAHSPILKGTKFGPFDAKRVFSISPHIHFPLKIFACDEYFKEYYLDNSSEFVCNWMYFVKAASYLEEQNLICVQDNNELYYITTRDLSKGEKLYVWYGAHYSTLMDKELLSSQMNDIYSSENHEENVLNIDEIVRSQEDIAKRESWLCKFCGMEETNLPKFTEHILVHYKHKMRRCCELCKLSFNTKVALAKHIRLDHEPHKNSLSNLPLPLSIISKKILKTLPDTGISNATQAVDFAPGGPLLGLKSDEEDIFAQSTSNLSNNSNSADTSGGDRSMAIELDTEMVEADEYLANKFNFNVDDEGIVCDVCLKSFVKLRSLILHLNKHTGKFCCKICEKVFARKENFLNHGCQAVKAHSYPCTVTPNCKRSFRLSKQLKHHIKSIHKNIIVNNSNNDIGCSSTLGTLTPNPPCQTNTPALENPSIYANVIASATISTTFGVGVAGEGVGEMYKVCARCNASFADAGEEAIHLCAQNAPSTITTPTKTVLTQYECPECRKMFNKRASLNRHVRNIHRRPVASSSSSVLSADPSATDAIKTCPIKSSEAAPFMCSHCSKQFANLRYLRDHQRTHGQKHVCKYCDKQFARLYTLKKHLNWHISFKQEVMLHGVRNMTCATCLQSFDDDKKYQSHILEHTTNTTRPLPPLTTLSTNTSAASPADCSIGDQTQTTIAKNNIMIHFRDDTSATLAPVNVTNMSFKTSANELINISSSTPASPTKPIIRFISTIITPRDSLANIDAFGIKKLLNKSDTVESHHQSIENVKDGPDNLQLNKDIATLSVATKAICSDKKPLVELGDNGEINTVDANLNIAVLPVVSSPNITSTMIVSSPTTTTYSLQNIPAVNKIKCKDEACHESFPSTRSMHHHYSVHHRRVICSICKRRFPNNAALVSHQTDSTCSPGSMITCSQCDGKFKLKSSLVRHVRKKHADDIAGVLISSGVSPTALSNKKNVTDSNKGIPVNRAKKKTIKLEEKDDCNTKNNNGQSDYLSFLSETSASNTSVMSTVSCGNPTRETLLTHHITDGSGSPADAPSHSMDISSSITANTTSVNCDGLDDLESNLDDIVNSYESVISENRRSLMLNDADMVSANTTKSFYEEKNTTSSNIEIASSENDNSTSNEMGVDDYTIGDFVHSSQSTKRYKDKERSTTIIRTFSSNNNVSQQRITESVLDFTSLEMDFQIQGLSRLRDSIAMPSNSKVTAETGNLSMPELTDIEIENRDIALGLQERKQQLSIHANLRRRRSGEDGTSCTVERRS